MAVELAGIAPFFVVCDVRASVAFYTDVLGFACRLLVPPDDPFFAIVRRGPVALLLKQIGPDTPPTPNPSRHPWATYDAMIYVRDVDGLHAELRGRGLDLPPVEDDADGMRGFTVTDPDGYALWLTWPVDDDPA